MSIDDIPGVLELRRIVSKARRKFEQELGPLARTYIAAMHHWDVQKADGVSTEERLEGLEKTLRVAWPQGREEPWHYACQECSDTGWTFGACVRGSCGRPFTLPGQRLDDKTGKGRCTDGHSYVKPCFCAKGDLFRQALSRNNPSASAVEKAARTSRPISRMGR